MKRIKEKVPGFDDIVFENRNKSYGAYDLRKRYRSAAGISLIAGVLLFSFPFILLMFAQPEPVSAGPAPGTYVVLKPDNLIQPDKISTPEPPKPATEAPKSIYTAPEVVFDSVNISGLMVTEFALDSVQNGAITDIEPVFVERPVEEIEEVTEPLTIVHESPEFPGGNPALLRYIAENTVYPPIALENNVQGKVFIKFAVTASGTIDRIEVMKGVDPLLDSEARRVISTLPLWKPGRQNGKAVPVWFIVPVAFEIVNR